MNLADEIAALARQTVPELRERYAALFGEATTARHKAWLVKRIAWRPQAVAEGELSERARQRALQGHAPDVLVHAALRPMKVRRFWPAEGHDCNVGCQSGCCSGMHLLVAGRLSLAQDRTTPWRPNPERFISSETPAAPNTPWGSAAVAAVNELTVRCRA